MFFCERCGADHPSQCVCEPVKKADPELERLLAEEEEIERRTTFLKQDGICTTVGDLRAMLTAFDDSCYLSEATLVGVTMDAGRRWRVKFTRIDD